MYSQERALAPPSPLCWGGLVQVQWGTRQVILPLCPGSCTGLLLLPLKRKRRGKSPVGGLDCHMRCQDGPLSLSILAWRRQVGEENDPSLCIIASAQSTCWASPSPSPSLKNLHLFREEGIRQVDWAGVGRCRRVLSPTPVPSPHFLAMGHWIQWWQANHYLSTSFWNDLVQNSTRDNSTGKVKWSFILLQTKYLHPLFTQDE